MTKRYADDVTIDYIIRLRKLEQENERMRDRLRHPTEEMLEAGREANRLVSGNALGLAYVSPDAAWKAMADIVLRERE